MFARVFHALIEDASPRACSAGFQTCCIADFQIGKAWHLAARRKFGNLRYSRLGSLRYDDHPTANGGLGDAQARASVTVDFAPLKNARAGELAAKFDIVIGVTPEA